MVHANKATHNSDKSSVYRIQSWHQDNLRCDDVVHEEIELQDQNSVLWKLQNGLFVAGNLDLVSNGSIRRMGMQGAD